MARASRSGKAWPCGWEDHRQAQLKRMARLPFSEKIRWLEEAHRLVLELKGKARSKGK
ncbi:MAG: hypothetical protein AAB074_13695 [Planctomycetota bacterium]